MKNIEWFKMELEPLLTSYEIIYKYFKDGDLGDLTQVEFNSLEQGGEVDFWSSGWLNIHFVNFKTGEVIINSLVGPEDSLVKDELFDKLIEIIR